MRDVFSQTVKVDGVSGLYKGFPIAIVGVVLFRAFHLGGYDFAKAEILGTADASKIEPLARRRTKGGGAAPIVVQADLWKRYLIAQTVSVVSGTLVYPIDSIRRRLMMQAGRSGKCLFCAFEIIHR